LYVKCIVRVRLPNTNIDDEAAVHKEKEEQEEEEEEEEIFKLTQLQNELQK